MPIYSYIPYLDPDMNQKAKESSSGHTLQESCDDAKREPSECSEKSLVPKESPAESLKRKNNKNLKILNAKATNVIQDGLNEIENLCNRVRGCLNCNEPRTTQLQYYESGDIHNHLEDTIYNSPSFDPNRQTPSYKNSTATESSQDVIRTPTFNYNNVYTVQHVQEHIPNKKAYHQKLKKHKLRSRPNSKKLKRKKSNFGRLKITSTSSNTTKLSEASSREKPKEPKMKKKRYVENQPTSEEDKSDAKKRLGQIERDYQKVVENLGMVEKMMACINERFHGQKKDEAQEKLIEETQSSRKTTTSVLQCNKVEYEKLQHQTDDLVAVKYETKTNKDVKSTDGSLEIISDSRKMNDLSRIKINESLSDIDALIDNAVQELGNLVPTDFDVSQNSSEVSFKDLNVENARNFYDECLMINRSSEDEDSEEAEVFGEDSEKFEISRSFQELKDTYLQQLRKSAEETNAKKAKRRPEGVIAQKSSFDRLHEEIFKDSSWNRLDPKSDEHLSTKPQESSGDEDAIKEKFEDLGETNYSVMHTKVHTSCRNEDSEDVITILLPSDKENASKSHRKKSAPKVQNIDAKNLDDDTIQITVTLKGDEKGDGTKEGGTDASGSERKCKKRVKRKAKDRRASPKPTKQSPNQAEDDDSEDLVDVYRTKGSGKIPPSTQSKTKKAKRDEDIKEIKKARSRFSASSTCITSSSIEEGIFKEAETKPEPVIKRVNPIQQLSIQCKKLIEDLVVVDNRIKLDELMNGRFNGALIQSLVGKPKRPRSVRIHTPMQDPDLSSIVPDVHRKRAISDLHDRMEFQIKQTDSFDGFLNLMNKNKRQALIKQAERQDHLSRCTMGPNFKKKYPFKVVTASVPPGFEGKGRDKKDPDRKYVNSLWFSPKDFKLRRNSRIFNKKRLEMYCQSLHKGPLVQQCQCEPKDSKTTIRASHYTIMVRSGTPIGRRPNTPRRWIQARPPTNGGTNGQRLHHCDILDDLTIKDLEPFKAEYPRHDNLCMSESVQGSLLYKLACGNPEEDVEGLMELVAPKMSWNQVNCRVCKPKTKIEKKSAKKQKTPRKSGDEASVTTSRTSNIQTLSSKAAAQLLMQNIGEIKSKAQASDRKETKTKRSLKTMRKTSKKIEAQESVHQKIEENLLKKIFYTTRGSVVNFSRQSLGTIKPLNTFKGVDPFQKIPKMQEINARTPTKRPGINKLFPYINDPENKVFQNITVLPVEVLYDFDNSKTLEEKSYKKIDGVRSLDEELAKRPACQHRHQRPSTAEDSSGCMKSIAKRRSGTPRSQISLSRRDYKSEINACPQMFPERESRPNQRCKRSNSVVKSTESESGSHSNTTNHRRKLGNPIPWKPSPTLPLPVRSRDWRGNTSSTQKQPEKNSCPKRCCQTVLVNREKTLRVDLDSTRNFHNAEEVVTKSESFRSPRTQSFHPNPKSKFMVDHLHALKHRNAKLQNNIQKAINIIEEKMVDVLSTKDHSQKKKTIDQMEKEINKVLKMIHERKTENNQSDTVQEAEIYHPKTPNTLSDPIKLEKEVMETTSNNPEETTLRLPSVQSISLKTKALATPPVVFKMPRPPRKRSISRISKKRNRPASFDEVKEPRLSEEDLDSLKIIEGAGNEEEDKGAEMYPSQAEINLSPMLRCPSPKSSITTHGLRKNTQKVMKKMSKEAFGKFADIVKKKTRLIINMTESIDPDVTAAPPAPGLTIVTQPMTLETVTQNDLMSTTMSSIVSIQTGHVFEATTEILSEPTTETSGLCNEKSLTSFSEPERRTTSCAHLSIHQEELLTPFVKALSSLRSTRFFTNRQPVVHLGELSPSFTKIMDFLDGFADVKEKLRRKAQIKWNLGKRGSFHGSLEHLPSPNGETRAISEHSIMAASTTSETNYNATCNKTETSLHPTINEIKKEVRQIYKSTDNYVKISTVERKHPQLVLSETQLISIPNKKAKTIKLKGEHFYSTILVVDENRYATLLKFFYVIYYGLVYFCMTAMNFTC